MARKTIPIILVPLAIGCSTPPTVRSPHVSVPPAGLPADSAGDTLPGMHGWHYHTMPQQPSALVFDNGDTLRTGLAGIKQLAWFTTPLGQPWFLFSGNRAAPAKAGVSLYVISPGDSTSLHALDAPWHMPGRLIDTTGADSYYEAEVFAGEVLRDTVGVIWYERSLMPDGQWRLNTTLLDLNGPQPDTLIFFGHGRKSSTLDLAFHGKCQLLDNMDQRLN